MFRTLLRDISRGVLLILASGLPSPKDSLSAASYEVTSPFVGVTHYHLTTTAPRLLDVNIVEIDPHAPGIQFLVTPSNGGSAGETFAQTTRSFVNQYQVQVGVNASFFASASGGNLDVQGLSASRGDIYSTFQADRLVALNISQDNLASIITSTTGSGNAHSPASALYNAVGGNELIVANGVSVAGDLSLHPRTAAGVTADGKILLVTVDGRLPGHSLGVQTPELAELMIRFGAVDAINLDGGGSTTLVFADETPRLVNVPSGEERAVGNNLGVFANGQTRPTGSRFVFSDFNRNDPGHFSWSLTRSPSTRGILPESTLTLDPSQGLRGSGAQRLSIRDDTAVHSGPENREGWFVRHLAGASDSTMPGEPIANDVRPAIGSIGVWAKTAMAGIDISIAIDGPDSESAVRGVPVELLADRKWRRYEWFFDDPQQWEAWGQGSGALSMANFTIDSIQLFGRNEDAVVFLDDVYHDTMPTIRRLEWDGTISSDWNNSANWNRNGVPGESPGLQTAVFGQRTDSPQVVTHQVRDVNRIEFDRSQSYLLTGRGGLRLLADGSGPEEMLPEIVVSQGDHEIELPVELLNDAFVRAESGSVRFKTAIDLHDHTLTVDGDVAIEHAVIGGGAIANHGTLSLPAGSTLAADLSSVGLLRIEADESNAPIFVDGSVSISGILDVSLVDAAHGPIVLFTASGTLDIDGLELASEDASAWILAVNGSSLLAKPKVSADFNLDGLVDGHDLLRWKSDFGVSAEADADGDGDSDGADFLAWQRNAASEATEYSSEIQSAGVPEPTSLSMLAASLMAGRSSGVSGRRRKRRLSINA